MVKLLDFFNKKGAVFGIDARIALVIISIGSLAIAVNRLSSDESRKLQEATYKILKLEDYIISKYATYHDNISSLETIYSATSAEQDAFWSNSSDLKTDPWGNDWGFKVFSSSGDGILAFGNPVEPKCIIIFSAGADGKNYLYDNYTGTTYADCLNNVSLPNSDDSSELTDDLFYKFTTISYEIDANKEVYDRLVEIKERLIGYRNASKNRRVKYCNDLDQVDADVDALCDVDSSGVYEETELDNVNYFPKSVTDLTAVVYQDTTTSYDNEILADRKALLTELDLPEAYNEDPLGRALIYNSNSTNSSLAPFVATVSYQICASCSFD